MKARRLLAAFPLLAALSAAFLAAFLAAPAPAQDVEALGGGALALDAADGVEWRREERLFVAEGDATARQGEVTLRADRLVAAYRDAPGGGLEIFRVDAEGAVRIENAGDVATGARAAFDLERRAIVLSAPGLAYRTGDAVVTAGETLEYDLEGRRAVARGDARVEGPQGVLAAPVIEARLADDGTGVATARAWGGVVIRTDEETIRASEATYDFRRRRAEATGDVRIARGPNVLTGAHAVVDMATGVSTLTGGGAGDGGRVRGLVFPGAER